MLREDNRLIPTTHIDWARASGDDAAAKSIAYVRRHWQYQVPEAPGKGNTELVPHDALAERIRSYSLCISGMAFQDAWNIELPRLERCCIHVITPELQLVPFCVHYLTGPLGQKVRDPQSEISRIE